MEYINSSYTYDLEDKKSINKYRFFFSEIIITWCNKQQHTVLIFTSNTKYVAISQDAKESM